MARPPALIHYVSVWTFDLIARGRRTRGLVESVLANYYERAYRDGLVGLPIPLWYRWIRAYYFAALKKRLDPERFQHKYWEMGSLTDYQRYLTVDANDQRTRAFLDTVLQQIRIAARSRATVLEIGCGDGLSLREVDSMRNAASQLLTFGVDISLPGLRFARTVIGPSARLIQADACRLPLTGPFTLGCGRGVLMFMDPQAVRRAAAEIVRVCERFVLAEPATVSGRPVDVTALSGSIERFDLDQTTWVHPYHALFTSQGARVVEWNMVLGNCIIVVDCCRKQG
jgi:hypothetical protein